jgi:two-component system CheB/CheR fusion protein
MLISRARRPERLLSARGVHMNDDDGRSARGWRVLVVDDNTDVAETTAVLLRLDGHEVVTAHDGPEALEAAAACTPDVVLLDIGLPSMDGYEVARRLRRMPHLEQARLIALTGYGQDKDVHLAQEAGIDVHAFKPVSYDHLMKLVALRG